MIRFRKLAGIVVGILAAATRVGAQPAAKHLSLADAAYEERRTRDALDHLVRAIAADPMNYEALWKASRTEVDLAEVAPKGPAMDSLLAASQRHGEAAIRLRPDDAEGHFSLALSYSPYVTSFRCLSGLPYATCCA